MKRLWMFLGAVFAAVALLAQRADYSKMSPLVRQAALSCATTATSHRAPSQERLITAFVQTTDQHAADLLAGYGCKTYAQLDDIAIATIPLHQLQALSHHPAIVRIEASQHAHTLMDTVPLISRIEPIYAPTMQHQAYTGQGVVMGLMDVGFDLTHPNFYSATSLSHYRISALWDQLSKDTIDSPFPVGRDFVGPEQVFAQRHSIDGLTEYHGTHTLGIAAGSGYRSGYRGVAFDSDICLVSNAVTSDTLYIDPQDYYKYTTAVDALGFKYLFDYADQQGKPCVISFSEGYSLYLDEDDGLFSDFLSKLEGPGRIIVASAGNENIEQAYAEKPLGTEQAGAFIRSFRTATQYKVKTDGPLQLDLLTYTGSTVTHQLHIAPDSPWQDDELMDTLFLQQDTCAVYVARYPSCFDDQQTVYLIQLIANRTLDNLSPIAIVMNGADCRAELYGSSVCALTSRPQAPQWNAARYGHNILGPGCFPSVLCVGATSHRLRFTNYRGELRDLSRGQIPGRRMYASSTGPSINGLPKPDVTAPGYCVISSMSSYYLENNPDASEYQNTVSLFPLNRRLYAWNACSGTSMSTPVVAGIIALWLQAKPTLTRQEVLDVLRRTCSHPDTSLDYPNTEYGYGEIDAYRGLLDILGLTDIQSVSHHHPADVAIRPVSNGLQLTFDKVPQSPVQLTVYSLQGTLIQQITLPASTNSVVTCPLPALPSGVYAVQLNSREASLTGSWLVRL